MVAITVENSKQHLLLGSISEAVYAQLHHAGQIINTLQRLPKIKLGPSFFALGLGVVVALAGVREVSADACGPYSRLGWHAEDNAWCGTACFGTYAFTQAGNCSAPIPFNTGFDNPPPPVNQGRPVIVVELDPATGLPKGQVQPIAPPQTAPQVIQPKDCVVFDPAKNICLSTGQDSQPPKSAPRSNPQPIPTPTARPIPVPTAAPVPPKIDGVQFFVDKEKQRAHLSIQASPGKIADPVSSVSVDACREKRYDTSAKVTVLVDPKAPDTRVPVNVEPNEENCFEISAKSKSGLLSEPMEAVVEYPVSIAVDPAQITMDKTGMVHLSGSMLSDLGLKWKEGFLNTCGVQGNGSKIKLNTDGSFNATLQLEPGTIKEVCVNAKDAQGGEVLANFKPSKPFSYTLTLGKLVEFPNPVNAKQRIVVGNPGPDIDIASATATCEQKSKWLGSIFKMNGTCKSSVPIPGGTTIDGEDFSFAMTFEPGSDIHDAFIQISYKNTDGKFAGRQSYTLDYPDSIPPEDIKKVLGTIAAVIIATAGSLGAIAGGAVGAKLLIEKQKELAGIRSEVKRNADVFHTAYFTNTEPDWEKIASGIVNRRGGQYMSFAVQELLDLPFGKQDYGWKWLQQTDSKLANAIYEANFIQIIKEGGHKKRLIQLIRKGTYQTTDIVTLLHNWGMGDQVEYILTLHEDNGASIFSPDAVQSAQNHDLNLRLRRPAINQAQHLEKSVVIYDGLQALLKQEALIPETKRKSGVTIEVSKNDVVSAASLWINALFEEQDFHSYSAVSRKIRTPEYETAHVRAVVAAYKALPVTPEQKELWRYIKQSYPEFAAKIMHVNVLSALQTNAPDDVVRLIRESEMDIVDIVALAVRWGTDKRRLDAFVRKLTPISMTRVLRALEILKEEN